MTPVDEVEFERIYDASPEELWRAWTDPEQIRQWWGPDNVIIPECEADPRVGGRIYIVMEAGEAMGPYKGTRWPMEGEYVKMEENSMLAYSAKSWTEGSRENTEIDQTCELYLYPEDSGSKLKLKITLNSVGPDAKAAAEGMRYGFAQHFDKLTGFLAARRS